jgi:hypothetical protein
MTANDSTKPLIGSEIIANHSFVVGATAYPPLPIDPYENRIGSLRAKTPRPLPSEPTPAPAPGGPAYPPLPSENETRGGNGGEQK